MDEKVAPKSMPTMKSAGKDSGLRVGYKCSRCPLMQGFFEGISESEDERSCSRPLRRRDVLPDVERGLECDFLGELAARKKLDMATIGVIDVTKAKLLSGVVQRARTERSGRQGSEKMRTSHSSPLLQVTVPSGEMKLRPQSTTHQATRQLTIRQPVVTQALNMRNGEEWSVEETACLLTHLDYCIEHDEKYTDTIQERLQEVSGKEKRTLSSIRTRLKRVAKKYCQRKEVNIPALYDTGTKYLDLNKLPESLVADIQRQRMSWAVDDSTENKSLTFNSTPGIFQSSQDVGMENFRNFQNDEDQESEVDRAIAESIAADATTENDPVDRGSVPSDGDRDTILVRRPPKEPKSDFSPVLEGVEAHNPTTAVEATKSNNLLDNKRCEDPDEHVQLYEIVTALTPSDTTMDDDLVDADCEINPQNNTVAASRESNDTILASPARPARPVRSTRSVPSQLVPASIPANEQKGRTCDMCKIKKIACEGGKPCLHCKAKKTGTNPTMWRRCAVSRPFHQEKDRGQSSKKRSLPITLPEDSSTAGPAKRLNLYQNAQQRNQISRTTQQEDEDTHYLPVDLETRPKKLHKVSHQTYHVESAQATAQVEQAIAPMGEEYTKSQTKTNILWDLMPNLIQQIVTSGKILVPELRQTLNSIHYTFGSELDEPSAMRTLVQDHLALDQEKASYLEKLRGVVGVEQHDGQSFPRAPERKTVDQGWKDTRNGIRDVVGHELGALTEFERGFLVAKVDELLNGRHADQELEEWLEGFIAQLGQLKGAQTLMSALFCRLVFATPDPMFNEVDPISMEIYKMTALTEGLMRVKHLNMIGTKLWFASVEFASGAGLRRATMIATRFGQMAQATAPHKTPMFEYFDGIAWARKAIELKQSLLISPMDYRIHFCFPGTKFDPSWMQAEDDEGDIIKGPISEGTRVAMCLFPAIAQQAAAPFVKDADVTDALVSRKRFFPTHKEKMELNPANVLSKAVVLLEIEESLAEHTRNGGK
ncbi:hypothetical protein P153DRAFT_418650 [Dothidotthia symphoricarpi CBS 119687]|uniref:Zn(2)-C6 fungal-type domain-containing protein n=1 Tax=Dothidotthia symphoricarpi CBS 119687 TaxID=1392245 RepID=A0A6A6AFT4_9PLEO|nr:uncharacterized protein P153DRAFT_418650 [Dothidotthia symphoricarpi CBS 119687]KAF2129965.1 hypothetical protein P153DRAFT_418650 [Dothidotthia symphoricarpi CBS 119687]